MFALLFFLLGCWSDQGLTHEVIKEVEVVVYDTAYVEVEVEVERLEDDVERLGKEGDEKLSQQGRECWSGTAGGGKTRVRVHARRYSCPCPFARPASNRDAWSPRGACEGL